MTYILFIIGLIFLAVGGDKMVSGAVSLAQKIGVSTLLIGIVLVGFGTSTPELVASILAGLKGAPDIVVGNVIGSNIANILLVLGVAGLLCPLKIDKKMFRRDGIFLLLTLFFLGFCCWIGMINYLMGLAFVGVILFYICYAYFSESQDKKAVKEMQKELSTQSNDTLLKSCIYAFGGIASVLLGAKLMVDSAIEISRSLGISEAIIGLTVVSVGTSLPELITSIVASIKKENSVAFGNVVGSNIFNVFMILGVVSMIVLTPISSAMLNSFYIMVAVTLLLMFFGYRGKITRIDGLICLILYGGYVAWLVS